MDKKISIAMATFNGGQYLREQLDSIISQTYSDFELIICDDGSNDSTLEILHQYENVDSRIHIYKNESNLGFLKNFEKAICLCTGEYIATCDQDDIWLPNHLQVLIDNLRDYSLVGGNAILIDQNNNELGSTLLQSFGVDFLPVTQSEYEFHQLHANLFQGAAMMFTKELANKAFPTPKGVTAHDGWLALCAFTLKGVKYVNIPILRYRQHGNNVTRNEKFNLNSKIKKILFSKKAKSIAIEDKKRYFNLLEEYKNISQNKVLITKAQKYFGNNSLYRFFYLLHNNKLILLSKNKKFIIAKLGKCLFI